uniref:ribose-phosphate diphosphokinase n=1 Tax=Pyrodinium bahamense TaxID=73915 RepID=A0A7S0FDN8_9DINO
MAAGVTTPSMNHGPLRLFSGNAHPQLARAIAAQMGVPLGNATVNRFPCGEVNVVIHESVRDCDVFVIQPTCNGGAGPQEHLAELLIMLDAIRRGASNRVTAVMPIFGYARQNNKEQSRSPITARLVTDLLQVAGANRVLTLELHASQIQGFAAYPIDNMYALPLLAREIESIMAARGLAEEDIVVVSPDVGGAKRASAFAKKLCAPLAIFSRQRRRPNEATEVDLVGEVAGKTCIIVDDIVDTCETLCVAADKLRARGASAAIGVAVHGILSDPGCERIAASEIELVIVTDTIPLEDKAARCKKLRVISVAPLLATAIERIHTSESLSELFEKLPPNV